MTINDKIVDALQSTIELNQKVAELLRRLEIMDERLRELDRRMVHLEARWGADHAPPRSPSPRSTR